MSAAGPSNVTPISAVVRPRFESRAEALTVPAGTVALLYWPAIDQAAFPELVASLELAYGRGLKAEALTPRWIAIRRAHPAGTAQA
jgi:hypothetical protein